MSLRIQIQYEIKKILIEERYSQEETTKEQNDLVDEQLQRLDKERELQEGELRSKLKLNRLQKLRRKKSKKHLN